MGCISQLGGGCMKPQDSSKKKKTTLIIESDELQAQARELLRTSHELIEQLKANMRKFEELLKHKDNHGSDDHRS
jgi:hypothetical protein